MRRMFALAGVICLALLLTGTFSSRAQDEAPVVWTAAQLAEFQSRAVTFYEEGVDENALIGQRLNGRFAIKPGMYMTDFTLRDLDGVPYNLNEQRDKKFIVFINGSWW